MDLILIILIVGLIVFLLFWWWKKRERKGWRCIEGRCERVVNGEFASYGECEESCNLRKKKQVRFNDNIEVYD